MAFSFMPVPRGWTRLLRASWVFLLFSSPAEAGAIEIASGWNHSIARIPDGSLLAWGHNALGQLGDGTASNRSAQAAILPSSFPAGLAVAAIAAGTYHSVALLEDGTLRAWGRNEWGELGDETSANRLSPVAVLDAATGQPLSQIDAIAAGEAHTLASPRRPWTSYGRSRAPSSRDGRRRLTPRANRR